MNGEKEPFIFISYAHLDSDIVLPIISTLEKNGFRVWYDNGISPGSEWPEYIARQILDCSVVLVFLSENSLDSYNCKREINYAVGKDKELLVIHLEKVEMSPGMEMQLNVNQAMFRYKFPDSRSFISNLCQAEIIQKCRIAEKKEEIKAGVKEEIKVVPEEEKAPEKAENQRVIIAEADSSQNPKKETGQKAEDDPVRKIVADAVAYANKAGAEKNKFLKFWVSPISQENMLTARKAYAEFVSAEDVIAHIDLSGRTAPYSDGVIVTKNALYSSFIQGNFIYFPEVENVALTENSHVEITLTNGKTKTIDFGALYGILIYHFFDYLLEHSGNAVVKARKSKPVSEEAKRTALFRAKVPMAVIYANKNKGTDHHFEFKYNKHLSDRQLANFKERLAAPIKKEDVIAFLDTTLLSSGKAGFVITNNAIYSSYFKKQIPLRFAEIKGVELINKNSIRVFMKNGNITECFLSIYVTIVYSFLDYLLNK